LKLNGLVRVWPRSSVSRHTHRARPDTRDGPLTDTDFFWKKRSARRRSLGRALHAKKFGQTTREQEAEVGEFPKMRLRGEGWPALIADLRVLCGLAIQHIGNAKQERRSARRALLRAVADAAAIRTKVG